MARACARAQGPPQATAKSSFLDSMTAKIAGKSGVTYSPGKGRPMTPANAHVRRRSASASSCEGALMSRTASSPLWGPQTSTRLQRKENCAYLQRIQKPRDHRVQSTEENVSAATNAPAVAMPSPTASGFSDNNYSRPAGQNVGNFLTDKPSSRVLAPPGGASTFRFC